MYIDIVAHSNIYIGSLAQQRLYTAGYHIAASRLQPPPALYSCGPWLDTTAVYILSPKYA